MNRVRAYLLGTLSDDQAAAVEMQYFTDRSFFSEVRMAEQVLIEDYLKGRLTAAEKLQFESRYLQVPQLQQAVEETRRRLAASGSGGLLSLRLVIAGALIAGLGLGGWIYWRQREPPPSTAVARHPPSDTQPIASLNLIPGLRKGGSAGSAQLTLRSSSFPVRINAELPGQRSTVACSAVISLIGADGVWKKVWTSAEPIQSTPVTGGRQVTLTLDSSVFQAGDYILQLSAGDGQVRETYVFRVN